jgi:hypothetical protein
MVRDGSKMFEIFPNLLYDLFFLHVATLVQVGICSLRWNARTEKRSYRQATVILQAQEAPLADQHEI